MKRLLFILAVVGSFFVMINNILPFLSDWFNGVKEKRKEFEGVDETDVKSPVSVVDVDNEEVKKKTDF